MANENAIEIIEKIHDDYAGQYEYERKALSSSNNMSPRYAIGRYAELLRLETAVKVLRHVLDALRDGE